MVNGRLPDSALAAIPGGRLVRAAAAAWNAMSAESVRRYGVVLRPLGSMSSYRTYAQQLYLWGLYVSGRGNLAAHPGTSNHGWGLAVDCASQQIRWIIDQIGGRYGFSKACSDAPSEWWHIRWSPGCTHATWRDRKPLPTMRRPNRGPNVHRLNVLLRRRGFRSVPNSDRFTRATESAVRRVQRKHHLRVDGVVGPATWRTLLR